MQQAKYSIILPVYNGGEYVKVCVNSILSQSIPEFELLVLDNCSTDGTVEWLRSLLDNRIRIIVADRPLSIEENWGRIKSVDKHEFITLIGHDDTLEPDYLAILDQLIHQYPAASLYQTHFNYIDSHGESIRKCKPMPAEERADEFLKSSLTNAFDIMGTGFMMRSADYDALGGIPNYPNLMFADLELWYRLTAIGFKATAAATGFSFRIHQSTTKTTADDKLQLAFERAVFFLDSLKQEDKLSAKVINDQGITFIHHYCRSLSHRLIRTPLKNRNGLTVGGFINKCKSYADRLVPGNSYNPLADKAVRLAKYIDASPLSRFLFLYFRKIYSKPVYK